MPYADPARQLENARRWYREHREYVLRKHKLEYAADPKRRALHKKLAKRWYRENRIRMLQIQRRYAQGLKREFVDSYGGKCECCGEAELTFLTLEHKRGDGKKHRRRLGSTKMMLAELKRRGWPKQGYGVLCFNCNHAEAWGQICPHKQRR